MMITPDEPKVLVLLEQQQHWVKQSIAQSDELLRELFKVLHPKFAEAEIKRDNGSIQIVPRKGTKGHQPAPEVLVLLDTATIELDPAIVACIALQQLELMQGLNPENARSLSHQIETAIAQSDQWRQQVKQTLERLDAAPAASIIPVGF
ncbi:MAG: hypothetical protein NW224_12730 [Leptolyngbyaceae cyanobacterium bins.302]|nr:hypothetical protein [Leptolyngbyaceae cyanobacterium bins.302]